MKAIALIDWDGTARRGFTLFPWVDYLADAGVIGIKSITALRRLLQDYHEAMIGHDDLASKSGKLYAQGLSGANKAQIERHARAFHELDKAELFQQATELLRFLEGRNVKVIVISGAPHEVLNLYRQEFQLGEIHALALESQNGVYTGNILANPGTALGKQAAVEAIQKKAKTKVLVGFGNSESDNPLFRAASCRLIMCNPNLNVGDDCIYIDQNTNMNDVFAKLDKHLKHYE